jgi:hypothetical protein
VHHLVRDTLGCECPEEVFDSIIVGKPTIFRQWSLPASVQVLVGWRLLITLVRVTELEDPIDDSIEILRNGRTLRDAKGLNRFRLVLVGNIGETLMQRLHNAARAIDDRVHIHNVTQEALGLPPQQEVG